MWMRDRRVRSARVNLVVLEEKSKTEVENSRQKGAERYFWSYESESSKEEKVVNEKKMDEKNSTCWKIGYVDLPNRNLEKVDTPGG